MCELCKFYKLNIYYIKLNNEYELYITHINEMLYNVI